MVYTFSTVDVNEYIASGILESVVLGLASDQEVREVNCLSEIYPEIKEELIAIEEAYEKMAFVSAVDPAPHIKTAVLAAIANEAQLTVNENKSEAKIIAFPTPTETTKSNPWKWLAAACVVLFVGTAVLWISSTNQSNELANKVAKLETKQTQDQQVLIAMQLEEDHFQAIESVITDHSMKKVILMGTSKDPKACVHFMWSEDKHKGIMVAECITSPPKEMQYQLWAIAAGKPVSLGLFDYDEVMDITDPFDVEMGNISAFAITMEKKGGSPTPTMENMIVTGTINS